MPSLYNTQAVLPLLLLSLSLFLCTHLITLSLAQPFFFGSYDTRISTVALCQLLSHCVSTGNQLLCGLLIEEEEEDGAAGVKTRSQKAASGQWLVENQSS